MRVLIGAIFALAFAGMFVVYPMYFFALRDFKKLLVEKNEDAWKRFVANRSALDGVGEYQALQESRQGTLGGIGLCPEVMEARRIAVRLLYFAMSLFMAVLAFGLTESVLRK